MALRPMELRRCEMLLLSTLVFVGALLAPSSAQDNTAPLYIDCGNIGTAPAGYSTDMYFDSGEAFTIPSNATTFDGLPYNVTDVERTGRIFPEETGGCYKIPRPSGTYMVRTSFAYGNFDSQNNTPIFNVTLQGLPVATVNFALDAPEGSSSDAMYRDFLVYVNSGNVDLCFVPFRSDFVPTVDQRSPFDSAAYPLPGQARSPIVNSIQVTPVPPSVYNGALVSPGVILASVTRTNIGGPMVGPDSAGRVWYADTSDDDLRDGAANADVAGADSSPDYIPKAIFTNYGYSQPSDNTSAATMSMWRGIVPMDKSNLFFVQMYFAEMNPKVKPGQRVFNITIVFGDGNMMMGVLAPNYDILASTTVQTGISATHVLTFAKSPSYYQVFGVILESDPKGLPAVMSGLEVYEVIQPPSLANAPSSAPWLTYNPEAAQVLSGEMAAPPPPSSSGGSNAGEIAAIVLGVILFIVLVAGGVYFYRQRHSNPTPFQQFEAGRTGSDANNLVAH
eukprot:TRINITY_DN26846_c0_g1_i1.p1 TRINITY_DN26846_c0_g1~~TRINITY_DN26846_c0_g1_i1.p1  ORF type:complete len:505 (-),score=1.06 TRINITY_DN26846_c0_g1_i1:350-1864(-)